MRRILVIVILACISFVANAEQITYSQVANAASIKDFKKIKITSYEASNGEVFSVGGVVTLGPAFSTEVLINVTNPDDLTAEIKKIYIIAIQEQGLHAGMQLRRRIGKLIFPLYFPSIEKAIFNGDIVSEVGAVASVESASTAPVDTAFGISQHTLSNGTNLVVGTTKVEILHTAAKSYQFLPCDTSLGGTVAKLVAIEVTTKGRKEIVELSLQTTTGTRIVVKDADAAIELGEIYIVQ